MFNKHETDHERPSNGPRSPLDQSSSEPALPSRYKRRFAVDCERHRPTLRRTTPRRCPRTSEVGSPRRLRSSLQVVARSDPGAEARRCPGQSAGDSLRTRVGKVGHRHRSKVRSPAEGTVLSLAELGPSPGSQPSVGLGLFGESGRPSRVQKSASSGRLALRPLPPRQLSRPLPPPLRISRTSLQWTALTPQWTPLKQYQADWIGPRITLGIWHLIDPGSGGQSTVFPRVPEVEQSDSGTRSRASEQPSSQTSCVDCARSCTSTVLEVSATSLSKTSASFGSSARDDRHSGPLIRSRKVGTNRDELTGDYPGSRSSSCECRAGECSQLSGTEDET